MVGELNLLDFEQSHLHMFEGQSVEIRSDGSIGGAAVVDVHGTDSWFPLVDLTLVKDVFMAGGLKRPSKGWGLDITARYVLAPGSSVLRIYPLISAEDQDRELLAGALLFPSDHTQRTWFSDARLELGSLNLDAKVAWSDT